MVDPVNLRQFRKRKQREEKAAAAETNRKLHALPKNLRSKARQEIEKAERLHEGNKRQREE